jgi:hypothetical protein
MTVKSHDSHLMRDTSQVDWQIAVLTNNSEARLDAIRTIIVASAAVRA